MQGQRFGFPSPLHMSQSETCSRSEGWRESSLAPAGAGRIGERRCTASHTGRLFSSQGLSAAEQWAPGSCEGWAEPWAEPWHPQSAAGAVSERAPIRNNGWVSQGIRSVSVLSNCSSAPEMAGAQHAHVWIMEGSASGAERRAARIDIVSNCSTE